MDYIPTFLITYELVDDETLETRNNICKGCEHFDNEICNVCHCKIFSKHKFIEAKCPIGKWK
jgi:hypothetical protein